MDRLNLLQLAPGGHLGRFIVWTQSAFEKLDTIFGSTETASAVKKGYKLPRPCMANSDLARLINSDEIQVYFLEQIGCDSPQPFYSKMGSIPETVGHQGFFVCDSTAPASKSW